MSALNQYIELYQAHGSLVEKNSAGVLNDLRANALDKLSSHSLPAKGSENYEITDLDALLAPDYGLNLARVPLDVNPSESFRCGVPGLTPSLFFMVNDLWGESADARKDIPQGVEVGSLKEMALRNPALVKEYYGRAADMTNPLVALNTLLVQDGLFLRVKKGVKLEKPLQLVNILSNTMPLMAVRRILVVIEEDAEARLLICDHTQNPDVDFLTLQTVEIFAHRNSRFDLYDLEESTLHTTRLNTVWLRQESDSNVLLDSITLYNGTTRNEFHCRFRGEGADLRLLGMGIEDKDRVLDTYSRVDHAVPRCHTDELFKYVVDDDARGSFVGRIVVDHGAEKTEAYQSNRNIVGSGEARMFSKPQLEIYNDDVKCSHGTAIGQLDALQVFYMRTRGLSEGDARLLLKQAFMADVIDGVRLQTLKDRLHLLVEARFGGKESACGECGVCGR
ncbi:MAG: SufD family Fe-S cluster assembly protein [Muribaculum sp.]|nr:SufD family Fe-S cluster assembly protein [Muribaculum sp.]